MGTVDDTLAELKTQIGASHAALQTQMKKLRTGRANVNLLDGIRVSMYGTQTPLNQCAQLTVAEPRLITVRPWDRKLIADIERAIMASDVGIMPQNDGEIIRLPIPPLTEERRRDLVKQAKHRGEEAKIGLRTHRRDANELLKDGEKNKSISQDELKRALDQVQELVNRGVAEIDGILQQKEKEILEI